MPHCPRQDHPDAVFHITGRVNWRVWHLMKPGAPGLFLTMLDRQLDEFGVDLLCFVVMSNHYHLVARSPAEGRYLELTSRRTASRHYRRWPARHYKSSVIAQCMRQVLQPFAHRLQGELNLTGRFWDGPFHAREIEEAWHLAVTIAYDHRNPVKAGAVAVCEDYQFSSASFWRHGTEPLIPLMRRGEIPFDIEQAAFREEVLRYQQSHALDDVMLALRKRRLSLYSLKGREFLRRLLEEAGLGPSRLTGCGTAAAPDLL